MASKRSLSPIPTLSSAGQILNDSGTVAFQRFFNDRPGEELVSGNGGPLTVIADTSGPFQSSASFLGFTPPAINNKGDVAFLAELDAGGYGDLRRSRSRHRSGDRNGRHARRGDRQRPPGRPTVLR